MDINTISKFLEAVKKKTEILKSNSEIVEEEIQFLKKELKFIVKNTSIIKDAFYYISEKKFGGTKNDYNSMLFFVLGITNKRPDITKEFNYDYDLDKDKTRLSPPDIDIDFEHRERVLNYLADKYGRDKVALIGTSITYKPKAAVQFCAKALNIMNSRYSEFERRFSSENDQEAKRISKIMMNNNFTLEQWIGEQKCDDKNPKIQNALELIKEELKKYPKVFEAAKGICGLNKSYGTHAAGVIISKDPITDIIPLFVAKADKYEEGGEDELLTDDISGWMSTQYDWAECESLGLLKFDFLQLNTLRQMTLVKELIKERFGEDKYMDVNNQLPVLKPNDKKVFETISQLKLEGLFQICGPAFTSMSVKWDKVTGKKIRDEVTGKFVFQKRKGLMEVIGCDSFEDIVISNALGRPGPLASKMHEEYAKSKKDPSYRKYEHKLLEPILEKTYGQMAYQEQLIKTAMVLANFSFVEADGLRKACAKKLPAMLKKIEVRFREGCAENNIPQSTIDNIWKIIVEFGEYGFNMAHSVAYAFISYQTAWLKTYFTTEFICAILTSNSQKDDEVFEISRDLFTKEYPKLKILPVDVNKSKFTFFPEKELEIRSPFDCIKGFSSKSSENIIKNQPYSSVYDFMVRAGGDLNKNELKILQEKNAFGTLAESEIVAREILSYQKMTSMNVKGKKTDINSKLLF